jgi:hypothetical protein
MLHPLLVDFEPQTRGFGCSRVNITQARICLISVRSINHHAQLNESRSSHSAFCASWVPLVAVNKKPKRHFSAQVATLKQRSNISTDACVGQFRGESQTGCGIGKFERSAARASEQSAAIVVEQQFDVSARKVAKRTARDLLAELRRKRLADFTTPLAIRNRKPCERAACWRCNRNAATLK